MADVNLSPEGVAALDALRFDYIAELFGYVASYAISAQEAARAAMPFCSKSTPSRLAWSSSPRSKPGAHVSP